MNNNSNNKRQLESDQNKSNNSTNQNTTIIRKPNPGPKTLSTGGATSKIIVNANQKGNPLLNFIRNVGWEFKDSSSILVDYQVGLTTGILFLSLKYNRLYPEHIYSRIKAIGQNYLLRIVLVLIDIEDPQQSLRDLTRVTIFNSFTMVLAWSPEEAARYIETLKAYEFKPADMIKEKVDQQYLPQLSDALTCIKTVSKTDVITLSSEFGSLKRIMTSSTDDFVKCPGFGDMKAAKLFAAFNEPFMKSK